MVIGARRTHLGLPETADFLVFSHTTAKDFIENGGKNKSYPVSGSSAGRNTLLMRKVRAEIWGCNFASVHYYNGFGIKHLRCDLKCRLFV